MKNFNEFRSTLTEEKLSMIANRGKELLTSIHEGQNTADPSYLGNQIAAIALGESLALLELYHQWLSESLEQG